MDKNTYFVSSESWDTGEYENIGAHMRAPKIEKLNIFDFFKIHSDQTLTKKQLGARTGARAPSVENSKSMKS